MADYRPPLRDISFVLDELADLAELCELDAFDHTDPDTVKGVIEEYGRWVADTVAPINRSGDLQGAQHDPATNRVIMPDGFTEAYQQYVEAGWSAVPFPATYGGGGFPWLVGIVMQELLCTANLSWSMAPLLSHGAIDLLLHHGSEEQREVYLPKLVTGEWSGTMNLTEPHAGSDVGAVKTKAVPQSDGTYKISGTKIYITFGEHDMSENIMHLVLARTPDAPPGTKGISCFIVPKYMIGDDGSLGERNDVTCVSIEHKLGIKASPTCVLAFGENEGATGYLIGEANQGMRYMFTMMNNARLGVAVHGLAIAERAYQDALQYSQERRQGRAPGAPAGEMSLIIDHPDVRRMLLTMKSTIEAMRGIIYGNAFRLDLAREHPDETMREAEQDLVDLLIPIAKAWCTDMGVEMASLAIQIYGGMGFIEEAGVAQHYRDVRITPIYEGTNGIQAMDLVGRKLGLKGGQVVTEFLAMVAMLDPALARHPDLAGLRDELGDAVTILADTTSWIVRHGRTDVRDALAGATPYLRMFSLVTAGWVMAKQALAAKAHLDAGEGDAAFWEAKITTARFFCEQILPQVKGLPGSVRAGYEVLYEIDDPALLTG